MPLYEYGSIGTGLADIGKTLSAHAKDMREANLAERKFAQEGEKFQLEKQLKETQIKTAGIGLKRAQQQEEIDNKPVEIAGLKKNMQYGDDIQAWLESTGELEKGATTLPMWRVRELTQKLESNPKSLADFMKVKTNEENKAIAEGENSLKTLEKKLTDAGIKATTDPKAKEDFAKLKQEYEVGIETFNQTKSAMMKKQEFINKMEGFGINKEKWNALSKDERFVGWFNSLPEELQAEVRMGQHMSVDPDKVYMEIQKLQREFKKAENRAQWTSGSVEGKAARFNRVTGDLEILGSDGEFTEYTGTGKFERSGAPAKPSFSKETGWKNINERALTELTETLGRKPTAKELNDKIAQLKKGGTGLNLPGISDTPAPSASPKKESYKNYK